MILFSFAKLRIIPNGSFKKKRTDLWPVNILCMHWKKRHQIFVYVTWKICQQIYHLISLSVAFSILYLMTCSTHFGFIVCKQTECVTLQFQTVRFILQLPIIHTAYTNFWCRFFFLFFYAYRKCLWVTKSVRFFWNLPYSSIGCHSIIDRWFFWWLW